MATDQQDASKASFKLDLIETVDGDPQMSPSELAVIVAFVAEMGWPSRETWLSISKGRARSGLSERQVIKSRTKLQDRGYLTFLHVDGVTKVYRLENPRKEDVRQHVALMTEHYRDRQKERQAERRKLWRTGVVPAKYADTKVRLSHSPGACDVPAEYAGNSPFISPLGATRRKGPIKVSSTPLDEPFPVPADEDEAEDLVMSWLEGQPRKVVLELFDTIRARLLAGDLTPADLSDLLTRAAA